MPLRTYEKCPVFPVWKPELFLICFSRFCGKATPTEKNLPNCKTGRKPEGLPACYHFSVYPAEHQTEGYTVLL